MIFLREGSFSGSSIQEADNTLTSAVPETEEFSRQFLLQEYTSSNNCYLKKKFQAISLGRETSQGFKKKQRSPELPLGG